MSRDHAPLIPLATARRAAVRVLRALASSPDVLRLGVAGALRRMEPRVPAVSLYATTLEPDAEAARRIERTVAELDFVQDGCLEPDLPFTLQVLPEADVGTILAEPAPPAPGTLTMGDVRGAFHLHTTPGRGRYALARVAQRATEEGYAWAVVTVPTAEAAALDALRVEAEQVRAAARRAREAAADDAPPPPPPVRLWFGLEAEPQPGGTLALPADTGDLVLLRPSTSAQDTAAALSDPRVKVLAHPVEADGAWYGRGADDVASWQHVLNAAAAHGVALEFSGAPRAAWLPDAVHALARELGVPVLPGADAEALSDIDDLLCAVGPLRAHGWTPAEVLGTRTGDGFAAWLAAEDV